MNIVFDLDGTLLDSKLRLYKLFQHLVTGSSLTYQQYWMFKEQKVSNQDILRSVFHYNDEELKKFACNWMLLIEDCDFLAFDSLITGAENTLKSLSQSANLYLCTARQFSEPVLAQLEQFNISRYFKDVLVTEQKNTKNQLIKQHIKDITNKDWLIGDTGADVQVGKDLNMNTCAVYSGFLSREVLAEYKPDLLLKDINQFSLVSH